MVDNARGSCVSSRANLGAIRSFAVFLMMCLPAIANAIVSGSGPELERIDRQAEQLKDDLSELGLELSAIGSEPEEQRQFLTALRIRIEEFQREVDEQQFTLDKIGSERAELLRARDALFEERLKWNAERERLLAEKKDLEEREKLFSMGFYAALFAALIAILGIIVKLPASRLENRMKELEIAKLERQLDAERPS